MRFKKTEVETIKNALIIAHEIALLDARDASQMGKTKEVREHHKNARDYKRLTKQIKAGRP